MNRTDWTLVIDAAFAQWTFFALLPFLILMGIIAGVERPPVRALVQALLILLSTAILGGVVGFSGGMSREAAVAAVIPAALTLVGAVALHIFGADMSKGALVAVAAACFAFSLFLNYSAAAQIRVIGERAQTLQTVCTTAYGNAALMASKEAAERFEAALGKSCARALKTI